MSSYFEVARLRRGLLALVLAAFAVGLPTQLIASADAVRVPYVAGAVTVVGSAQAPSTPGAPFPVRLVLTVVLGGLFLSGAGLIGVRWKRNQSLPLILVVMVLLCGIAAVALLPGALPSR